MNLNPFRKRIPRPVLAVVLIVTIIVGYSWVRAITSPGQESFAARNAEWMRDHHLGSVVDRVEQYQYSHDQPPDGGTPDQALIGPTPAPSAPTTGPIPQGATPQPMRSPAATPFPNEGQWTPAGPLAADGTAGVYVTRVRPNPLKTSLVVFVARVDPSRSRVQLVAGTELPGGTWSHPPQITADECSSAILAFNGGFRFDQSAGGWYSDGREAAGLPLQDGAASLVTFADGSVTVGTWGRDVTRADLPKVRSVRQNLTLLVDGGAVVPTIDDGPKWGARLKNSLFVWRSGYGVSATGELLYVGGPGLTPRDLAERLIDAGAVRGMQGDINPEWVAANLIHADAGGCHGTPGLNGPADQGGQRSSGDRYLSTDTRDFVEILSR